jgi:hypothetical protein
MDMKRLLYALLALLAFAAPARAQGDPISQVCRAPGLEWLCRARDLYERVRATLEAIESQVGDFAGELESSWFRDTLSGTALGSAPGELTRILGELDAAVAHGPQFFREALRRAVEAARRAVHLAPKAAPGTPEWWRERAVDGNPATALADAVSNARRDEATVRQGEAVAAQRLSQELADRVAKSTTASDTAEAVLAPSLGGVGGGSAARLEDAARTAVSSRAGIQVLTEGLADLMRQDASFSASRDAQLKVLVQQQALTNWQLQLVASSLSKQLEAQIAERQAVLQAELAGAMDEGQQIGDLLENGVRASVGAFASNADRLKAGRLGW